MNDPLYFDNPAQLSDVDLSEKQTDKVLSFSVNIDIIPEPKVYAYLGRSLVKNFDKTTGIEVTNANRDFKLTISGTDFDKKFFGRSTLVLVYEVFTVGSRDLKRNLILRKHSQ